MRSGVSTSAIDPVDYSPPPTTVSVVIPALNEAQSIATVLKAIPEWVERVVVADNGSTDETADIARRLGATVVREPRIGYGSACLRGLGAVGRPDVVVFLDADHSDEPAEMNRLVEPIMAGVADLVVGSRVLGQAAKGSLTLPQRLGNALASFLIRKIWRTRCTDLGPFRAIRFDVLEALRMDDIGCGWTVQMQARAWNLGYRVAEVPVTYRKRIGRSKVSGTVRGVVGAGSKILSTVAVEALRPIAPPPAIRPNVEVHQPFLSIIIPALNEAATLAEAIASAGPSPNIEIIVVDGGSTDATVETAVNHGARVLTTAPNRAGQMNAGAAQAQGSVLLFLHADTRLPFGFERRVREVLADDQVIAGGFPLAFDEASLSLRVIEAAVWLRSRLAQLPYGDQALFLRRDAFYQLGGYRLLPVMEDYEFITRLRRLGRIVLTSSAVITSARRWRQNGMWQTTWTHQRMILGWHLGMPPERLSRWRQAAARQTGEGIEVGQAKVPPAKRDLDSGSFTDKGREREARSVAA